MRSRVAKLLPAVLAGLAVLGPAAGRAQEDGTPPGRVIHTPWLALRFDQVGIEAQLVHRDTYLTEVTLERGPFTIVLPTRSADDVYKLTAWLDDSIFAIREDPQAEHLNVMETPAYFGFATGMADTAASSGKLMLGNDRHHFLQGLRLGPDPQRHVFYVSEVLRTDEESEATPIEAWDVPLYLVVYYDEDGDEVVDRGEYEFLVLRFRDVTEW